MVVGSHLEARSVTTHKPVSWLSDSSHFPGRRTARRTRARNVPLTEAPLDSAPRSAITGTANLETGGGGVGVDGGGGGGAAAAATEKGCKGRGESPTCTFMCLIYQHRYYYGSTRPELGILHTYGHLYLRDII